MNSIDRYANMRKFMSVQESAIAALGDTYPGNVVDANASTLELMTAENPAVQISIGEVMAHDYAQYTRPRLVQMGFDPSVAASAAQAVADSMAEATAVTTDVPVSFDGLTLIANLDQTLRHARMQASGQVTEDIDALSGFGEDLRNVFTLMMAAFGWSHQAMSSVLMGETPPETLQRLWPTAKFPASDGDIQQQSVVVKAFEMLGKGALATALKPILWAHPTLRTTHDSSLESSREIGGVLAKSEWQENYILPREMSEHHAAGFGTNPFNLIAKLTRAGVWWPGIDTTVVGRSLSPPGTEERLMQDMFIREHADAAYAEMSETATGKAMLGLINVGAFALDVIVDPQLYTADLPVAAVKTLRGLGAQSSKARASMALAKHTGKPAEIAEALTDARKWVATAAKSKHTEQGARRHAHAMHNLAQLEAEFAQLRSGPRERIVLTPGVVKANPDRVRKYAEVFEQSAGEAGERFANVQHFADTGVKEARRRVHTLETFIDVAENPITTQDIALQDRLPGFRTWLKRAETDLDTQVDTRKWLKRKLKNPDAERLEGELRSAKELATPYDPAVVRVPGISLETPLDELVLAVDDEILRNIRRGVAANAPDLELMQWELQHQRLIDGTITPQEALRRPNYTASQVLANDLKSSRIAALRQTAEPMHALTDPSDATVLGNRINTGADAAEQAGEAARVLAAGGSIDDVAIRQSPVDMYLNSYAYKLRPERGGMDRPLGANPFLPDNTFNTTVEAAEWQQSVWEKASDVWTKAVHPKLWNMRPSAQIQHMREPMWGIKSVDPRLMDKIDNAYAAKQFELDRINGFFDVEFRHLGIWDGKKQINEELADKWFKIMDTDPTSPEFAEAMRGLNASQLRSARRMRQMMDFAADKMAISDTDRSITGYITHVWDDNWFKGNGLPLDFMGIPADQHINAPFLMRRHKDTGVLPDITVAVDRYTRALAHKMYTEPLLDDMLMSVGNAVQADPKLASWYPTYINNMMEMIRGKPSWLASMVDNVHGSNKAVGNAIRHHAQQMKNMPESANLTPPTGPREIPMSKSVSKRIHDVAYAATTLSYTGLLAGNPRYFYMSAATALATTGARYGLWRTAEGVVRTADPQYRKLAIAAGVEKQFSQIFDTTMGTDVSKNIQHLSNTLSNIHLGSPSLQFTENQIRGWTFHAALSEMMTKTGFRNWNQVVDAGLANSYIADAASLTLEVNHRFGPFGRSPFLRRITESGTSAAFQFLTFPFKQAETLADMTAKNPGYIGRYMGLSGAISRVGGAWGVDLGQYVGAEAINPITHGSKSLQSNMLNTMRSLVDYSALSFSVAFGEGTQTDLYYAGQEVGRNLENLIPVVALGRSAIRRTAESTTSDVRRGTQLVREMDLGAFQWDAGGSLVDNLSRIPLGFYAEGGGTDTEMASTITGLRSTQANLEKAQFDAAMHEIGRKQFFLRRLSDELDDMLYTGNDRGFDEAFQRALDAGVVPKDLTATVARQTMQHGLPRMLRLQADNIDKAIAAMNAQQKVQR